MEVEPAPALRLSASPATPGEDGLSLSPATRSRRGRFAVDPDTCLEVFRTHWGQAQAFMSREHLVSADDIEPVMHYLDQMLVLLIEEPRAPPSDVIGDPRPGPILSCALELDVFDRVFVWSCSSAGDLRERLKEQQLQLYETAIAQARQPLLLHRAILRPLAKLVNMCEMRSSHTVEKCLVRILHQLAICVAGDQRILALTQSVGDEEIRRPNFLLDLLIHFMHRDGEIGVEANHALSLLIALSSHNEDFGVCIATESHFCPVLACTLSGLYSRLPRKILIPSDDWHRLRPQDTDQMPDMANFLRQLDFCNTVIEVGHPKIKYHLLKFIHSGFLVNVLGASLHQNSLEEVIAATAYLELFLRKIRAPALLAMFLKFIITDFYDNYSILDSLIARINYNTMLGVVTMSLFQTIIDFHCEDVMYYLIFRYLIPCRHLLGSQRRSICDTSGLIRSAQRFRELVPACCLPQGHDATSETASIGSGSRGGSLCSSASSSVVHLPDLNDAAEPRRVPSGLGIGVSDFRPDNSYVEYLIDANSRITEREQAVRSWEFRYDGSSPPPDVFDQPTAPATQVQSTFRRFLTKRDDSPILTEDEDESLSFPPVAASTPPPPETPTTPLTPFEAPTEPVLKPYMSMKSAVYTLSYLDDDEDDDDEEEEEEDEEEKSAKRNEDCTPSDSPRTHSSNSGTGGKSLEAAVSAVVSSSSNFDDFISALQRIPTQAELDSSGDDSLLSSFDVFVSSVMARYAPRPPNSLAVTSSLTSTAPVSSSAMEGLPRRVSGPLEAGDLTSNEMDSGVGGCSIDGPSAPLPGRLARPPGYGHGASVTVGPFLTTLLCKLESLPGNSFYVNLLITGLLSSLAAYPCPLIRSFLLHTGLVLQPSVKSLHHVLFTVRQAIDHYARNTPYFATLLQRARLYLRRRLDADSRVMEEAEEAGNEAGSFSGSVGSSTASPRRLSESLLVHLPPDRRATSQTASPQGEPRRRPKLFDLFTRRSGPDLSPRALLSSRRRRERKEEEALMEALSSVKTRNMVYAALILEEFTKELAALCQENAVRPS